ncbi:MAG TPA: hypothetical protein VKS22_04270 [Candidatus Binataceae bacterium]|nr:hypothetical protein [Candidatus Binataceae bacterium]
MAIKLFELGYVIKAIDKVSGVVGHIREQFEGLDASAKVLTGMGLEQIGEQMKSAGEGVLGGVESIVEAASETQSVLAKLGAVTGWTGSQLDTAREAAEKFSSMHQGSTDEFLARVKDAAPVFHSLPASIDAATQALKLHAATGIDAAAAMNLFTETGRACGNSAIQIAGTFAAVTKVFGVTNLDAVPSALGRLAGATLMAKGNAAEALGVMAEMQHILGPEGAGRAAMALSEVLTHGAKYGIDTQHGLVNVLDQVRARLATMGHAAQIDYLSKVFGATAGVRLLPLIEETGMLRENLAKVASIAPGAVAGMEGINEATEASKKQIFWQSFQNLKDALGALLGKLSTLIDMLTGVVNMAKSFADTHQTLTKYLLIFAGVAGVAAIAIGTLLTVFGSIAIVIASATGLAAAWAIAIGVGVVAAVAAVIAWWPQIKNFFVKIIPEAFQWGVNLLKTFAKGIESAVTWPIHAIEGVLGKLRDYLPHSPAKVGPLRDLNRIRLVETIAETIRPSPIVAAMHRTALATMIAAPMLLSGMAGSAGPAPVQIVVNYSPTIPGGSADEWAKAAKRHAAELMRIIEREMERRDCRSFSA